MLTNVDDHGQGGRWGHKGVAIGGVLGHRPNVHKRTYLSILESVSASAVLPSLTLPPPSLASSRLENILRFGHLRAIRERVGGEGCLPDNVGQGKGSKM